jgi:hypothetical protein
MITQQDVQDYRSELIDMSRRAAHDALAPEIQQLRAQNQHLRAMAQRAQNVAIEQTLDREIPNWRACYRNPAFADWLAVPDVYSGAVRSQLMRHAVDAGDAGRVASFYRGFLAEGGQAPVGQQHAGRTRQPAAGKPIYSREQIRHLYAQRRLGHINDANWARIEADIIAAGRENRVTSSFDKYGNERRLI